MMNASVLHDLSDDGMMNASVLHDLSRPSLNVGVCYRVIMTRLRCVTG